MELYLRPATTFVAGFIGSPAMNLAAAERRGDAVAVDGETFPLPPGTTAASLPPRVLVGVRPEHFELSASETATLTVQAELVEALGADTLVHAHAGGANLTLRLPGGSPVRTGDRLPVRVAPDHVHLFDQESGLRIG